MSGNINKIRFNSKYGYTLVELLAVIALFAIILSIGFPSLKSYYKTKERIELMEFKRNIEFARNSAIVQNCNYIIYLYKSENKYEVQKISKGIISLKTVELNTITLINNNFNDSISFTPTGAPSQAGTILLKDRKGNTIEITVEVATGKVNLYYDP